MNDYIKNNIIFIVFFLSALVIFYNWWKTTNTLTTNDVMLQGLDILAGLVLTLSFVMMVYEHNKSNRREKNQRVLQLTLMNQGTSPVDLLRAWTNDSTRNETEAGLKVTADGTRAIVVDASNQLIRQLDLATRKVTTLAGSGSRGQAEGVGMVPVAHVGYDLVLEGVLH